MESGHASPWGDGFWAGRRQIEKKTGNCEDIRRPVFHCLLAAIPPSGATAAVQDTGACVLSSALMSADVAIVLESLAASAQIGLLAAVGAALARASILDARGRHTVSQCSYYVFIPSLSFVRLATSPQLGGAAGALAVNMAVAVTVGAGCGYVASRSCRVSNALCPLVMAAAALGNQANLPLVVVHALCQGKEARAALLPAADGAVVTARECSETGAALVLAPVWVASTLQFLIADTLRPRDGGESVEPTPQPPTATELAPLRRPSLTRDDSKLAKALADEAAGVMAQRAQEAATATEADALLTAAETATPRPDGVGGVAAPPATITARTLALASRVLRVAAVPPSMAAVAGLIVGATPLRVALAGEAPPLALVTSSLEALGGAMIPALLLVLGAELAAGPGAARVPARATVAAVTTRLLVMPALGGALLATRVIKFSTPLATLVAQLAWSTPSAAMLATLAVKHGAQPVAMAALLFYSYVAGSVSVPAVAIVMLRLLA